ncbi:hypothetical protein IBA8402_49540 [Pseudomonas syringae]
MPHDLFGLPLLGEEYCNELEQMVPCLDFEPSTEYFGVMREGKINTFFRPSGNAAAQLKYFKDQL